MPGLRCGTPRVGARRLRGVPLPVPFPLLRVGLGRPGLPLLLPLLLGSPGLPPGLPARRRARRRRRLLPAAVLLLPGVGVVPGAVRRARQQGFPAVGGQHDAFARGPRRGLLALSTLRHRDSY
ncbi:hypothetical protein [Streptomyces phaeoluteigriseus]|uniref:hypothetical protein n=1 Tax=Streptomyces phaeoluteigriseus TaxID=114686 RepID=UPI003CCC1BDF